MCFDILRLTFETALKLRGGPSLVFAHSLGNNVFRYFLEWLKLEIAPKHYIKWLDEHIHAYFAVGMFVNFVWLIDERLELYVLLWHGIFFLLASGPPFLGSIETVKATLSGYTFGLPVSEVLYCLHNTKLLYVWVPFFDANILDVFVSSVNFTYLKPKVLVPHFITVVCSYQLFART